MVLALLRGRTAQVVRFGLTFELLRLAVERAPSFWRYRLYAGAIGYKWKGRFDKVIPMLEEAIQYEDCPAMVKNILAALHEQRGNFRRAAEIYAHILETSNDPVYLEKAERKLREYGDRFVR